MIDKLDWIFLHAIATKSVRKRAEHLGYSCKEISLKGAGRCLQIEDGFTTLFARLAAAGKKIRTVFSVPSRAGEMKRFLEFSELIFDPERLKLAKIVRLDIAFDLRLSFSTVEKGLIVELKGNEVRYRFHSQTTGKTFGNRGEMIRVYDKTKEARLSEDVTRIEVQYTGRCVPCRSLYSLIELLVHSKVDLLLKAFKLIRLNLVECHKSVSPDRWNYANFQRFIDLVEVVGFDETKKFLNRNGHFKRDFSRYVKVSEICNPVDRATESLLTFSKSLSSRVLISTLPLLIGHESALF